MRQGPHKLVPSTDHDESNRTPVAEGEEAGLFGLVSDKKLTTKPILVLVSASSPSVAERHLLWCCYACLDLRVPFA